MRSVAVALGALLAASCSGGAGAGEGDRCGVVGGRCAKGQQCCESRLFGLAIDRCVPRDQACPVGCPDGVAACEFGSLCRPDEEGSYACVDTCEQGQLCSFNLCCPAGASCEDGACVLPDLELGVERLADSVRVELEEFGAGACELAEGCIGGTGHRLLLRFDLLTVNRGEGDLLLGSPVDSPLFHYSECHGHYHFGGFAAFRLFDDEGAEVASAEKFGFCLLDGARADGGADPDPRFRCDFQGLQAGWADVYPASLPCQWVDVTGVAPGDYTLEVMLNPQRVIFESDFEDAVATVPVSVPANSCPGGCRPPDETCCAPDDPCGRAGDGVCDCGGVYSWDDGDCGACYAVDPWCDPPTSCPGGCQPDGPDCTVTPEDGVCDCGGAGDEVDCAACLSEDPDCPAFSTCPGGCTAKDAADPCCASDSSDTCGLAGDGVCHCGGATWDADDCAYCIADDEDCPS